jgi:ribosomal protein L29
VAVIKKSDIKKLTKEEIEKKIAELETALLELEGEGKREKKKPVKKAIARLKTRLTEIEKSKVKK